MADNVTSLICSSATPNENTQIILSALTVFGSIVTALLTYCLKRDDVKRLMPGLKLKVERKKILHDTIEAILPGLEKLKQELSARSSDSPDNSASIPPKKEKDKV
jgi:hypothetical protein